MLPNTVNQIGVSTGTLGSATGRTIFTNGNNLIQLSSVYFILNATATVGNRVLLMIGKDSSGNIVWRFTNGTSQTASAVFGYTAGPSVPQYAASAALTMGMPNPCYLPPSGTITVFDGNNVDVNDNIVAGQIIYTF